MTRLVAYRTASPVPEPPPPPRRRISLRTRLAIVTLPGHPWGPRDLLRNLWFVLRGPQPHPLTCPYCGEVRLVEPTRDGGFCAVCGRVWRRP